MKMNHSSSNGLSHLHHPTPPTTHNAYRIIISLNFTKSQWASFSTGQNKTWSSHDTMWLPCDNKHHPTETANSLSTVPQGYCLTRTLFPPITISSRLPTTANGTWSYGSDGPIMNHLTLINNHDLPSDNMNSDEQRWRLWGSKVWPKMRMMRIKGWYEDQRWR